VIVTGNRADALARLDVFAGEWVTEDFRQRFTGTFSEDGNIISGAWEKSLNGSDWAHDLALTYRRAG
jgi:hypothetical protein